MSYIKKLDIIYQFLEKFEQILTLKSILIGTMQFQSKIDQKDGFQLKTDFNGIQKSIGLQICCRILNGKEFGRPTFLNQILMGTSR